MMTHDKLTENWDPHVGLWRQPGPGHTSQVADLKETHPARFAAERLVAAGQIGALSRIDVEKILSALRKMQCLDGGEHHGCMRWYWEERRMQDTNSAFFTGLNLIVFRKCRFHEIDAPCQRVLDAILADLMIWFSKAITEKATHYPNKYLGDLVCAWLLGEILENHDERLPVEECMREAAAYWTEQHWGWGEHMSDGYATVCLDELSVLLLLSTELPEQLRKTYQGLLSRLLAIEDAFGDGPRVPAIRSYAFQHAPAHVNYRDRIRPYEARHASDNDLPSLHNLLFAKGWRQQVMQRVPQAADVMIDCFDGATAVARVESDIRIGSLSKFPIMQGVDHKTWGLSWQCFPVALWTTTGQWGFLQWEATEHGRSRAHPALEKHTAYLSNALTNSAEPPVVGRTFCLQKGTNLLAVRVMPRVPKSWQRLSDRFRLVDGHADTSEIEKEEAWTQLLLRYPGRTVSVNHVGLNHSVMACLVPNALGGSDLDVSWRAVELEELNWIGNLWGISIDGPVRRSPEIRLNPKRAGSAAGDGVSWTIRWEWPGVCWFVNVTPFGDCPLMECRT